MRNSRCNQMGDVIRMQNGGLLVVLATTMTGGGTGHGPGDVYPDGHQLIMKRMIGPDGEIAMLDAFDLDQLDIDWKGKTIKKYQTGPFCSSAMLAYSEPRFRMSQISSVWTESSQNPEFKRDFVEGDRGFKTYLQFKDTYGHEVRVKESSSAVEAHIWIFLQNWGDEDNGGAHLNAEQATELHDALGRWLDEP